MFIKDIFQGKYSEEEVHNEFLKFSRGDFKEMPALPSKSRQARWEKGGFR